MYAMDRLQANLAAHGTAFFAHHQTAGKGQRGKSWQSEPGSQIALSVVADTSWLSLSNAFPLSVAVALAAHDLYSAYAGEETRIKWPNDIYWRDRKAGGILIENIVRGNNWPWAVIGIGMNVNQKTFPETIQTAVSLKQITGRDFSAAALAKELCSHLETRYQQLRDQQFDKMLTEYNEKLYRRNQATKLKKGSITFHCVIESVSPTGELLVSGSHRFRFGEVEWKGGGTEEQGARNGGAGIGGE
ncbi:biotin--[acetyl-CoA-carboxylase] ligase [Sediminibacterium sp. WSJ-3]|nr:biotin--[acetyl-CoA-carboxylase] ligase [Sediminibacterium soli]